jgi:hypothetical protein
MYGRKRKLEENKLFALTIDARMINASGIGVYIRNLLPIFYWETTMS